MKDRNGTRIRSGSYLVYCDNTDIFKVDRTARSDECTCCYYVYASCIHGPGSPFWNFTVDDMPDVLVIPRRMVVPKLKLDQIKLYVALAGMEVVEEDEEDEHL